LKVFIDVNVFIDVMTRRSGWTESLRVLNLARKSQEIESYTSALTLPLLYLSGVESSTKRLPATTHKRS
jgi:predicted nucleic acid-binding protein